jgi:hypothetical protein
LEHGKGQGRKKSISDTVRKKVVRTTRRRPHSSSTRSLSNQYRVGKTSVDRILTDKNFDYRKPKVTKILNKAQKDNRVNFCKDMTKWRGRKLKQTFYSDETGKDLSDSYKHQVWNPPRKQVKVDLPKQDV